jgi:murein tripeptide amidase MpaA
MWRKNRQPSTKTPRCYGRDINRQWPYQWDSNESGASPDPCDETYRGESPSDGPESQGLVAFTNKLRDAGGIKLYVDWHSYGQHILSPWGYVCTAFPDDSAAHVALAGRVADAVAAVEGTRFDYGPSCSTLYATTGDSVDYLHGPGKADWAFTVELRDTGSAGFVLPPAQILGSAKEQWEGMKVMLTSLG